MKIWQWTLATVIAAATGVFTVMAYAHSNFFTLREGVIIMEKLDKIEERVDFLYIKEKTRNE